MRKDNISTDIFRTASSEDSKTMQPLWNIQYTAKRNPFNPLWERFWIKKLQWPNPSSNSVLYLGAYWYYGKEFTKDTLIHLNWLEEQTQAYIVFNATIFGVLLTLNVWQHVDTFALKMIESLLFSIRLPLIWTHSLGTQTDILTLKHSRYFTEISWHCGAAGIGTMVLWLSLLQNFTQQR